MRYMSTSGAFVTAHFYDLERFLHSCRSLDGRYIYFTHTQHYIETEDRDHYTLVGLLDGKLAVYTYDREYMFKIIPEVNREDERHPHRYMDMKGAEEEHDERSIFIKHDRHTDKKDRSW